MKHILQSFNTRKWSICHEILEGEVVRIEIGRARRIVRKGHGELRTACSDYT